MSAPAPDPGAPLHTALRVVMMPRDTNQYGTIFGGVILSFIDQAGFIEAKRHGQHRWLTVHIEAVDFVAPVYTGDVVSFQTRTLKTGTTSVTVRVKVVAERYDTGHSAEVTEATLTMVAVDAAGKPIPFRSPPSIERLHK
jgi:acyl-CoA thioesterase YciA